MWRKDSDKVAQAANALHEKVKERLNTSVGDELINRANQTIKQEISNLFSTCYPS